MNPVDLSNFSDADYRTLLQLDLSSFVERSFRELNPQVEYIPSQYIDLICAKA